MTYVSIPEMMWLLLPYIPSQHKSVEVTSTQPNWAQTLEFSPTCIKKGKPGRTQLTCKRRQTSNESFSKILNNDVRLQSF